MISSSINRSERDALYLQIYGAVHSMIKRSVAIMVYAFSGYYANVEVHVTGIRGTVKRNIIVAMNEETLQWQIISGNKEYIANDVADVGTVCRTTVAQLSSLVSKI